MDLEGKGYWIYYEKSPEILVSKNQPADEQSITILHEILEIKYKGSGDFGVWSGRYREYDKIIEAEARKLHEEDPNLVDYILSKAEKVYRL